MTPFYTSVEVKNGQAYGDQPGCGCCGGEVVLTARDLDQYLDLLKERVEQVRDIRTTLFGARVEA